MAVFHTFIAGGKRYLFDANTNAFIVLSEALYADVLNYKRSEYKHMTPAIEKLIDRGYLRDRPDFEMVHPMDSTLEYALERCIGTIALQVTQGCNLRCKYCAYSGNYDNRVHSSKRMSKETALKVIDFLFDHSIDRDRVSLGFYGGEPLLELNLIKECVEYAKKKSSGKELMFNMTSNATLITDEVLEFLYDNKFSYEIFKMYLQKLGRFEEEHISKLVSHGFHSLKEIHDKAKISASASAKRDHHSGPCVPGIQRLFVDVEGNLYPCERVSEASKAVRMGNLETGFDIDKARAILNIGKLTEKECKQCWAFKFCSSCAVQADDLEQLSAEKKLQNCAMIRAHVDNMMRDYCVMRDLGCNFDKEKLSV